MKGIVSAISAVALLVAPGTAMAFWGQPSSDSDSAAVAAQLQGQAQSQGQVAKGGDGGDGTGVGVGVGLAEGGDAKQGQLSKNANDVSNWDKNNNDLANKNKSENDLTSKNYNDLANKNVNDVANKNAVDASSKNANFNAAAAKSDANAKANNAATLYNHSTSSSDQSQWLSNYAIGTGGNANATQSSVNLNQASTGPVTNLNVNGNTATQTLGVSQYTDVAAHGGAAKGGDSAAKGGDSAAKGHGSSAAKGIGVGH